MNFSWRSISAARWRWGFPIMHFRCCFHIIFELTYDTKIWKCFPCVDIGKVLGVRTTTTEAIKWWLSANDEVILEERTRHFGVLSVLSTIQIISPCTDTIQQFDIELGKFRFSMLHTCCTVCMRSELLTYELCWRSAQENRDGIWIPDVKYVQSCCLLQRAKRHFLTRLRNLTFPFCTSHLNDK